MRVLLKKVIPRMINDYVSKFLEIFPTTTKEECDYVHEILEWDDEKKMAFRIANKIFEEEEKKE